MSTKYSQDTVSPPVEGFFHAASNTISYVVRDPNSDACAVINIKKMIKKLSIKEIVNLISQNSDVSKKKIYNFCLKIKNES